jgi:hypothetical protein
MAAKALKPNADAKLHTDQLCHSDIQQHNDSYDFTVTQWYVHVKHHTNA